MKKVLVLCTGNSCRSQMAEGYLKQLAEGKAEIFSAGVEAHGLNVRTIAVMKEDGIDISKHTSNLVNEYVDFTFDFVITVCDNSETQCPSFPGKAKLLHQNFPDPARAMGNEEQIMSEFRWVRDVIKTYCKNFVTQHLQ